MTLIATHPRVLAVHDRPARWTIAAVALAVLAGAAWSVWPVQVDDSFIVYRYADHTARGLGLVWNPGQDPVEGFTNLAWVLGHVPAVWLGVDLPLVSKLLGLAAAATTVVVLATEPRTRIGAVAAAGAFAMALPTSVHALAGLETAAIGLVVLRAVVLGARTAHGDQIRPWELPGLLLAAGLLRPEGVAAVAPALLLWWAHRPGPAGWSWTAAAAGAGAGYMAWRWSYFGHPFPNTFYVKTGQDAALNGEWIQVTAALLLPLLMLTATHMAHRPVRVAVLVLATVAALFVVPAATAPAMDYLSRFAWHAVPVLCLAAGWAIDRVPSPTAARAATAVTLLWMLAGGLLHAHTRSLLNYGPDLDRAHAAIGRGLAAADVDPAARTLAVSDAGAIPYLSGWNSLDYIGLNDERIARGADPTEAVVGAAPTVVIVTSSTVPAQPVSHRLDVAAATAGYEQVAAVRMRDEYWQIVYAQPEYAAAVGDPVRAAAATARTADESGEVTVGRWLQRLQQPPP